MNSRLLFFAGLGLSALLPVSASAEDNIVPAALPTAPARAPVQLLDAAQLDELVGPIALHPDALVALILPAAGSPSDIVLAARYVSAGGLIAKVDEQQWDDSVKSLARYPDIVQWMDENLAWTKQLGETFSVQPADVMKAIQRMRAKARALGTLKDTPQQRVEIVESTIRIVPVEREVIYVPYYDPEVVYIEHRNYGSPFITFSAGFAAGYWLAYDFDWHVNTIWVVNPRDRDRCWRDHHDWHRWTPPPPTHYHDRPRRDPTPDFCHEWRPREDSRPRPGRVVQGPRPDIVRPTLPVVGGYSGNRDNGRWNGRRDGNNSNERRDDRDHRGNDANANNGNRSRPESDRNRSGNVANNPRQTPTPPANVVPEQTPAADTPAPVATAPAQPRQQNPSRQWSDRGDRSDRRGGEPRNPNPTNNPGAVTVVPNPTPTPAPVTVVPAPTTPAPDATRSTRVDQRRERGDRTDRYARNNDNSNSQRSAPSQPSYTPAPQPQNNPPPTVTRSAPQPSQPRQEYSQPPRQERSQPRNDYSQSQPSQPRQQSSEPWQERMHPRQETVARLRESPPPPPPPPPPPAPAQTENKSSSD